MKPCMLPVLGVMMTTQAMATDVPATHLSGLAVDYHYGMDLDIARVIALSDIPDECHVVTAEMIYEDSSGEQHTLRYRVMGTGCQGN